MRPLRGLFVVLALERHDDYIHRLRRLHAPARGGVYDRVERFGCRATVSFEFLRSEFCQNSFRIQKKISELFRKSRNYQDFLEYWIFCEIPLIFHQNLCKIRWKCRKFKWWFCINWIELRTKIQNTFTKFVDFLDLERCKGLYVISSDPSTISFLCLTFPNRSKDSFGGQNKLAVFPLTGSINLANIEKCLKKSSIWPQKSSSMQTRTSSLNWLKCDHLAETPNFTVSHLST